MKGRYTYHEVDEIGYYTPEDIFAQREEHRVMALLTLFVVVIAGAVMVLERTGVVDMFTN